MENGGLRGSYGFVEEGGDVLLLVSVSGAENHHPVLKDTEVTAAV